MAATSLTIGVCLLASIVVFLSLSVILRRIPLFRRKNPAASTPPRSVTPEKKGPRGPPPDYRDVFPPPRRASLTAIPSTLLLTREKLLSTSSLQGQLSNAVPLASPIEGCTSPAYTPTAFSTEDIKALGDFPDYAELSGVPLPEPYPEFVIEKALPRPYRPFRWAYHQTMCRLLLIYISPPLESLIRYQSTNENGAELVVGTREHLCYPDRTTKSVF